MDKILESLQGKAFHLSDDMYNFLSGRYRKLINHPLPDINIDMPPQIISLLHNAEIDELQFLLIGHRHM